jgi:hypothetical protein
MSIVGLLLFLRQGMWGWAKALTAAASAPQEQIHPSSAARPAHSGHSAVVHVLATIVTSIHDRRAP